MQQPNKSTLPQENPQERAQVRTLRVFDIEDNNIYAIGLLVLLYIMNYTLKDPCTC